MATNVVVTPNFNYSYFRFFIESLAVSLYINFFVGLEIIGRAHTTPNAYVSAVSNTKSSFKQSGNIYTMHLAQPLDKTCFSPLKAAWSYKHVSFQLTFAKAWMK